jgi:DNA-binding NarL/FixJ family response regulator
MTRIIPVDDHPVFRNGLRTLLQASDNDVVGEAVTGPDAVDVAARLNPDVALMDLGLPDMSGVEWRRHSDLNRGPAVYEVDRPVRCGTSVESQA